MMLISTPKILQRPHDTWQQVWFERKSKPELKKVAVRLVPAKMSLYCQVTRRIG